MERRLGVAYYIVLDNANPGFDTFVNGKAIIRDAQGLSKLAKSLGLRPPEEYFAMSAEDAEAFDVAADLPETPDQWFDAEEGLTWVDKLRGAVKADPMTLKSPEAVLSDLEEFERVFTQAKAIGAKWHFSVDF